MNALPKRTALEDLHHCAANPSQSSVETTIHMIGRAGVEASALQGRTPNYADFDALYVAMTEALLSVTKHAMDCLLNGERTQMAVQLRREVATGIEFLTRYARGKLPVNGKQFQGLLDDVTRFESTSS